MNNPLISVIIPTYNRAWALAGAVDSVLGQDYPEVELIVVDDGSTDETPALLAAYGNALQVITLDNGGVSRARNHGVAAAQGEYIAFLDSDDRWLPEKLSEQAAFFKANPEARICQTEELWIRNGKRVNPCKHHKKPSGDIFEASLHLCLVSPSAVMLHGTLLKEVGLFDEALPACEDYDLWLRIACTTPVYTTPSPLVIKHGGHDDQLSKTPFLDRFRIQSLVKLLKSGVLSTAQAEATRAVLEKKGRIYAGGCRKHGRDEEADAITRLVNQTIPAKIS
ncbi:glycosyltransferase family 2 protein [Desulfoluna butyratoxydans]|uniref:Nucleotide-diphospho-sugar transferases n=1 Tax=Desulfoluna butyratoxydans TaxID=231438 RepID=A0A4U8YKD9_9BACT|nr:glycosyltransferase family A protein [Desulfoluna butyratoxydans]VFQ43559.1 nucleotide-diphospho-sugar transferases [Desulfoluna butyratoxydans]